MRKTIIIAEAGVNHNGSIEMAKKLIDIAACAGVDYVKFQTFTTENLITRTAKKAEYQKKNMSTKESQYEMLKKLELTHEHHFELINYCNKKNVKFLSTAFDLESIDFLSDLNLGLWKIPSGEITNYPYLKKIAQKKQPIIISTGMSTMVDIKNAIEILLKNNTDISQLTVLHCNTQYPTPIHDVNLLAMQTIAHEFGVNVGYSDHTLGLEVPIAAVALGATVIEKHFTIDRNMDGPDHKASLEPDELKYMVIAIRNIEKALGSSQKKISESESENIIAARKSIVAAQKIKKGEIFTEENLTVKRPGAGISPMKWDEVIGMKASKNFNHGSLIEI